MFYSIRILFSSELKYRIRAGRKHYLDVWPVNFLSGEDTDVTDNTSLFLFQLACIVNMVRVNLADNTSLFLFQLAYIVNMVRVYI